MRKSRLTAFGAAVGVLLPLSLSAASPAAAGQSEFAKVRAATAKYHNESRAIADGYERTEHCVPGMGYHYVNFELFAAPLDPLKPAALIYAPHGNGDHRKLIGVEYFVIDADQNPDTDNSVAPTLFGQEFDGPMPGHGPDMPVHYDLHAYIWTTNPNGILATSNPEVECP